MKIVCCVFVFSMCFVVNCQKRDDGGNCFTDREDAREAMIAGNYIPQWNEDGTYMVFQCWNSVGECWCANKDGDILKRTDKPEDCEGLDRDATINYEELNQ